MKILHLDTGRSWRGGQQQVLYLHHGLVRRGVDSLLVCTAGGELHRRAQAQGLPVRGLPLWGEWDVVSAARVAAQMKRFGATHLHLHSSHAQAIGLVAARFAGMKNVIATRRVDFVPRRHALNRWKYGPGVARFVAISSAIEEILVDFGVPREAIRRVPSGVDVAKAAPGTGEAFRRELGLAPGDRLIGNVAHLADHKGQRYLVEAIPAVVAAFPQARFVIVGQGELEADLKARAQALGLGDRLVFTGFRPDVPAILDALDLFVMPSHLEGLGTIVMDALAAGKPVVATRAGGIPDIIEDGRHGLLVPVRDAAALSGAILRLLRDPDLARSLAEAGKARVAERFSFEAMVEGNLAVYRELAP